MPVNGPAPLQQVESSQPVPNAPSQASACACSRCPGLLTSADGVWMPRRCTAPHGPACSLRSARRGPARRRLRRTWGPRRLCLAGLWGDRFASELALYAQPMAFATSMASLASMHRLALQHSLAERGDNAGPIYRSAAPQRERCLRGTRVLPQIARAEELLNDRRGLAECQWSQIAQA